MKPFPIQPNDNRNPPKVTTQEDWLKHQRCDVCGQGNCRPSMHDVNEVFLKQVGA